MGHFLIERGTSISLPPEVLDGDLNDLPNAWCLTSDTYGNGSNKGSPGTETANCTTSDYLDL